MWRCSNGSENDGRRQLSNSRGAGKWWKPQRNTRKGLQLFHFVLQNCCKFGRSRSQKLAKRGGGRNSAKESNDHCRICKYVLPSWEYQNVRLKTSFFFNSSLTLVNSFVRASSAEQRIISTLHSLNSDVFKEDSFATRKSRDWRSANWSLIMLAECIWSNLEYLQ